MIYSSRGIGNAEARVFRQGIPRCGEPHGGKRRDENNVEFFHRRSEPREYRFGGEACQAGVVSAV